MALIHTSFLVTLTDARHRSSTNLAGPFLISTSIAPFPHRQTKSVTKALRNSDKGKGGGASGFIGGFFLGGIVVGTLGFIYAPQISKVATGVERAELMKKLPKFIYDEEKALEKTRRKLAEKIAKLNAAIDDVSSQLRLDEDRENSHNLSPPSISAVATQVDGVV